MEIVERLLAELSPYGNNPRKNDSAVDYVVNSIQEFGFKIPLVVSGEGEIICGHTRYKAAQKLGLEKVPCIIADDLSDEQIKAFRLADNQTSAIAEWDLLKLDDELAQLSVDFTMDDFGFDLLADDDYTSGSNEESARETKEQKLHEGGEVDVDEYDDDKFQCTCPKCGFRFNPKEQ